MIDIEKINLILIIKLLQLGRDILELYYMFDSIDLPNWLRKFLFIREQNLFYFLITSNTFFTPFCNNMISKSVLEYHYFEIRFVVISFRNHVVFSEFIEISKKYVPLPNSEI